jgi:hypothetical protein
MCVGPKGFQPNPIDARPSCAATSSAKAQLYVADHAGNVTTLPAIVPVLQAAAG